MTTSYAIYEYILASNDIEELGNIREAAYKRIAELKKKVVNHAHKDRNAV